MSDQCGAKELVSTGTRWRFVYVAYSTLCSTTSHNTNIAGDGIGIRINDDGVDVSHLDFESKFDTASSCQFYTPVQLDQKNGHGTAVASIAAASANTSCSVGVAPGARVSSVRILFSAFVVFEQSFLFPF